MKDYESYWGTPVYPESRNRSAVPSSTSQPAGAFVAPAQPTAAAVPTSAPAPSAPASIPAASAPVSAPTPAPSTAQPVMAAQAPVQYAGTPAPMTAPAGNPAIPVQAYTYAAQQGVAPNAAMPARAAADSSHSVERWLGAKALSVIAAVLLLAGIVLLGVTAIPQLPDSAKAIIMFALSVAFAAAGGVLTIKRRNVFSVSLLCTGTVAVLASIVAGKTAFGLYDSTVACILLVVWMVACAGLLWFVRSLPLTMGTLAGVAVMAWAGFIPSAVDGLPAFVACVAYCIALGALGLYQQDCAFRARALDLAANDAAAYGAYLRNAGSASLGIVSGVYASVIAIAFGCTFSYTTEAVCIALALPTLALLIVPQTAGMNRAAVGMRRLEAAILTLISCFFLVSFSGRISMALCLVALVAALGMVVLHVLKLRQISAHPEQSVATLAGASVVVPLALAFTFVVLAYLSQPAGIIVSSYVWSAVCMACALVAVALGFALRNAPLRLYGLVLVLVCVFKLVMLDTNGTHPLAHVLSFIIAGAICFAISALYSFAAKRMDAHEAR